MAISPPRWTACLFLLLLSACRQNTSLPDPVSVEPAYLNRQIELTAPTYYNSFKNADSIGLKLLFHADKEIRFRNYYGVRVFEYSPSGWTEIGEAPTEHIPSGDKIFSPVSGPNGDVIGVFPKLQDPTKPHRVRIYVIGEMQDTGGLVTVGAYTDITLQP